MSVEGIPQRDVVVTFSRHFASYNAGESASFTADEAARLAELGVTGDAPPPTAPPENVDLPHVSQAGTVLTCTMGNWTGTPTGYAYQWAIDGGPVGTDDPAYDRQLADIGATATCVVTATNAAGSTAAPPSNGIIVE